jgi:TolB-like protein/Tfp pilus assembly protein PilF
LLALNVGGLRDRLSSESAPRIDSIAVLPLENLSGDPEQEYFSDGMTDELIGQLAQISALKVISRTSVMQYKGARKPLPAIAKELNVEAVLEGTVRRSGDRVRITAQLIEAATDRSLWAETYERDMRDILELQSEVAQAVAREIQITVTPEESKHLASTFPVDPEAHEAYLWGNFFFNKESVEGWRRAVDFYEQALEKDPRYAPAHAALARTLAILPYYVGDASEFYTKAKKAGLTAIELDETLAKAHISLGFVEFSHGWNWAKAEREFQRAIELEPGSAEAHLWYGNYLVWMGRSEEGMAEGGRGLELDPLSLVRNTRLGMLFYFARKYDKAIKQLKKALDMDPNFGQAHAWLFFAHVKKECYEDAHVSLRKWLELDGYTEPIAHHPHYTYLCALWGKREEGLRALNAPVWAERLPWERAIAMGALGEKDEAFQLLEQAYHEREPNLALSKVDPRLDPLRDDPRFQDFLRRMDFPE